MAHCPRATVTSTAKSSCIGPARSLPSTQLLVTIGFVRWSCHLILRLGQSVPYERDPVHVPRRPADGDRLDNGVGPHT